MRIVLDTNIFFSLMNTESINSYLFLFIDEELFAPEFLKSELEKHKEECIIKSGLSEHEFRIRQTEIEESIKFFKEAEYEYFLKESAGLISDFEDIDFLALALSTDSAIWSSDPHLANQKRVKVFTTEELIKFLFDYHI